MNTENIILAAEISSLQNQLNNIEQENQETAQRYAAELSKANKIIKELKELNKKMEHEHFLEINQQQQNLLTVLAITKQQKEHIHNSNIVISSMNDKLVSLGYTNNFNPEALPFYKKFNTQATLDQEIKELEDSLKTEAELDAEIAALEASLQNDSKLDDEIASLEASLSQEKKETSNLPN